MPDYKIGLVVADKDEYLPFAATLQNAADFRYMHREGKIFTVTSKKGKAEVHMIFCGVGKVNAAAAATHFADIGCDIIANFGLSGGISGVKKQDVTVPSRFLEHDFDLSGIGYKPFEKPWQEYIYNTDERLMKVIGEKYPFIKTGTAVSGDAFICDSEKRNFLKESFGAMSCDMETAAIASVCRFSDIPFLALRRISDDAGDDALGSYREMNTSNETVLSEILLDIIRDIIDCESF